jgi:hypothetical protein
MLNVSLMNSCVAVGLITDFYAWRRFSGYFSQSTTEYKTIDVVAANLGNFYMLCTDISEPGYSDRSVLSYIYRMSGMAFVTVRFILPSKKSQRLRRIISALVIPLVYLIFSPPSELISF